VALVISSPFNEMIDVMPLLALGVERRVCVRGGQAQVYGYRAALVEVGADITGSVAEKACK
jgi:hypothetical protein